MAAHIIKLACGHSIRTGGKLPKAPTGRILYCGVCRENVLATYYTEDKPPKDSDDG